MANKKETQIKNGNIKFDPDLDFDFDDSFNIIDPAKESKKRSPIKEIIRGTTSGAKKAVKTTSFWDNVARKALPSSYKIISDELKQTRETISSIYRDSTQSLKPELSRIGRQIDSLVPAEASRIKRLTSKLLPSKPSEISSPSAEVFRNQSISQAQDEIFGKSDDSEIYREARDRAEKRVKDQIDTKRFYAHSNILGNIAENIAKITSYTTSINSAYQKKSLELQYRSYYVQSEMLAGQNKYFEAFKAYLDSIRHNTSLPDFVKITHSEQFKQASLNKLFNAGSSKLSAGVGRIGKRLKGVVAGSKEYLEQAASGLEAIGELQEHRKTARELGFGESALHDLSEAFGGLGANKLGGIIGKKLQKYIKPGGRVSRTLATGSRFVTDPTSFIEKLQNSKRYQTARDRGGIIGGATNILDLFLGDLKAPKQDNELTNESHSAGKLAPHFFSNRAHISIVEVIPGLLSRILQEQTAIRLGRKTLGQLQIYDYKKGSFAISSKFRKEVKENLIKETGTAQIDTNLDHFARAITGKELDSKQNKRIKDFSYDVLSKNHRLDILSDEIFNTKEFSKLSQEDQELIKKQHSKFLKTKEGKDALTYIKSRTTEGINAHIAVIQKELADRIERGEASELLKARLIKYNNNGGFDINRPVVTRLIRSKGLSSKGEYKEKDPNFIDKLLKDNKPKEVKIKFGHERSDLNIPNADNTETINKAEESKPSPDILITGLNKQFNRVKVKGSKLLNTVGNRLDKPIDLYLPNGDKPILSGQDFDKGKYFNRENKPIKTLQDIKNANYGIYNDSGELIVTPSQLLKGLYDEKGRKVKFNFAKAKELGNRAKLLTGKVQDRIKPFINSASTRLDNLVNGPINNSGNNVDNFGNNYTGQDEPLPSISEVISGVKNFVGNNNNTQDIINKLKQKGKDFTKTKVGERLINLKDRLKNTAAIANKSKISQRIGKIGSRIGKFKGIGNKLSLASSSIYNKLGQGLNNQSNPNFIGPRTASDEHSENFNGPKKPNIASIGGIRNLLSKAKQAVSSIPIGQRAFNDPEGTGRRNGDFRTRLEELAQRDAEKKAEQAGKPTQGVEPGKYRSNQNGESNIFGLLKNFTGFLTGGIGRLFNFATGTIGVVTKATSLLFGAGKLAVGGVGALAKGGGFIGKALSTVGSPIAKVIAKTGATGLGRFAGAAFSGLRVAAGAASVLVPGLGGILFGGLSAGITLLGAALSSPVVLGALAVGAVAYGSYKLFKYLTRDNLDKYQKFRYMQYGFGTHEAESFNHKLANLENYLINGRVYYERTGEETFEAKFRVGRGGANPEEIFKTFEIDPKSEQGTVFAKWYKERFSPFFLNTLTALHNSNRKGRLFEINKLTKEERAKFLKAAIFEEGPYNEIESPVVELSSLASNKQEVITYVDSLLTAIQKESKTSGARGSLVNEHKELLSANSKDKIANLKNGKDEAIDKSKVTISAAEAAANKLNTAKQKIISPNDKNILNPSSNGDNENIDLGKGNGGKPVNKDASSNQNTLTGSLITAGGAILTGNGAAPFLKLKSDKVNLSGLNDAILRNFLGMVEEYGSSTGKTVTVNSGFRTFEEQQAEYAKDPSKAAKPGSSLHNFGLAIDIHSPDAEELEKTGLMRKYGFTRPIGKEPWHLEPAGIQGQINEVKNNPGLATQLTDASLGKGGGGQALISTASKGSRDAKLQFALFDASAKIADSDKKEEKSLSILSAANDASDKVANIPTSFKQASLAPPPPTDLSKYREEDKTKAFNNSQSLTKNNRYFIDTANKGPDNEPLPNDKIETSNSDDTSFPLDREGIKAAIDKYSQKVGVPSKDLQVIGAIESGLNNQSLVKQYKSVRTSSAKGVFQFTDASWRDAQNMYAQQYGLTGMELPQNVKASTILAGANYKRNLNNVKKIIPNAGLTEAYLAHFLGSSGAQTFLTANPDMIASEIFPRAAEKNADIFFDSGKPLTISEVYSKVSKRLQTAANSFGISGVSINKRFPEARTSDAVFRPNSDQDSSSITLARSSQVSPIISQGKQSNDEINATQTVTTLPRREISTRTSFISGRSNRPLDVEVDNPMKEMIEATINGVNIQKKSLETLVDIRDMMKILIESRGKETRTSVTQPLTSEKQPVQNSTPITPIVNIGRVRSFNS